MSNDKPSETECSLMKTCTSSMTMTSATSPSYQVTPPKFFHTHKRTNRSDTKKRIFQTNTPHMESISKYKETYIDLLIHALDMQLRNGSITMQYLQAPTLPRMDNAYQEETAFNRKCDNKMCAVVVENACDVHVVKFTTRISYKGCVQGLCAKCYDAFVCGNYCYYCNMIYREFEFNQQYYDSRKWIQCDYCGKWQHVGCEEQVGKVEGLEERAMDVNYKYKCPFCRKESEDTQKEYMHNEKSKHCIHLHMCI